jgi:hypothetical protein
MKKYIILLFSALLFITCTHKGRLYPVEQKQAQEIKTGIRYDTVFQDITFGASQHHLFQRFREMVYLEKLTLTKSGTFELQTRLDTMKLKVGFNSRFFHDSLYCFSFIYKGKDQVQALRIRQLLADSLQRKFGSPILIPSEEDTTKRDFYYVRGNQKIELKYPYKARRTILTLTEYTLENRKILEGQEEDKAEKDQPQDKE